MTFHLERCAPRSHWPTQPARIVRAHGWVPARLVRHGTCSLLRPSALSLPAATGSQALGPGGKGRGGSASRAGMESSGRRRAECSFAYLFILPPHSASLLRPYPPRLRSSHPELDANPPEIFNPTRRVRRSCTTVHPFWPLHPRLGPHRPANLSLFAEYFSLQPICYRIGG